MIASGLFPRLRVLSLLAAGIATAGLGTTTYLWAAVGLGTGNSSAPGALQLAEDQPKSDGGGCICMEIYLPVCATPPNGAKQTYSNACFAKCAKATVIHKGPC